MKIKYCPKCKSTNIELDPTALQSATAIPQSHRCENCGFESIAFPEKETDKQ